MSNIHTLKPFKSGDDPRRNKNGRPKGSKNGSRLDDLIRKHLYKKILVNGKEVTRLDYIAEKILDEAVGGDMKAIKLVFERTEGKPKTAAQMEKEWEAENRKGKALSDEEMERLSKILPAE